MVGAREIRRIEAADLRRRLDRGEPIAVGDVRAPAVYAREPIPGSGCLFLREVDRWEAAALVGKGLRHVSVPKDGLGGWRAAGLPIEGGGDASAAK